MHSDRFATRNPYAAATLLFLFCSFCTVSHAGELAVSSVPEQIDITLKYAGGKVILFGEAEEDALIVARLMAVGHETTKLNKKGKRGIFWKNVKVFELSNVPPLYIVHASGPLEGLPDELRIQTGSDRGYTAIKKDARLTPDDPERDLLLENYFILKQKQGLYGTLTDAVHTIKGRLFKSEFFMPSNAPAGLYRFDVFAVKDNAVIASGSTEIRLGMVGIESWLTDFAQEHGLLYGLVAVVTALVAGIAVGLVFRGAPHA